MKKYVSNKDESARLFESDFLELFTHVHPVVPLMIYVPGIVYFLARAVPDASLTSIGIAGLFALGIGVWTLTEYLLHKHIFHYEPSSVWGKRLHFLMHGVHHDYPNDSKRLVMPPVVSIPLATLFYVMFHPLLGPSGVGPFFAGFLFGYLCYDMIHYATHHFAMKGPVGLWLKHHHMRHHYQDNEMFFGVSSPLWDFVFRTFDEKEKANDSPGVQ